MRASRVFLGTATFVAAACAVPGAAFLGACDDNAYYPIPPLHEAAAPSDAPQVDAYQAEAGGDGEADGGADGSSDAGADVASDALEDGSADAPADAPEDVADE